MKANFESLASNPANFVALSPISFLRRAAELHGGRDAYISSDMRRSWGDMALRVQTIAANLNKVGIGEGDTVTVLSPNNPELFELHFALPLSGGVLNTLNTRLEATTIAYILEHAESKLIIVEASLVPLLEKALDQLGSKLPVLVIAKGDAKDKIPKHFGSFESLLGAVDQPKLLEEPNDEWQAIALNYTSGTSGRPKGVVYHHRGAYLMALGTVAAWQLPPYLTYLSVVPMFHCNGWAHPWVMAILGGTMVFVDRLDPEVIFTAIQQHKVTHFGAAPVVLQMLTEGKPEALARFEPPIQVMTAGAPPPPTVLEKASAIGFQVMQVYGLTETYGHITQCLWQDAWGDLPAEARAKNQAMQGIAFPMVESVKVFDRESGTEVPHDSKTQGEIAIRGNTVMKGYYKDPEASAEAFQGGWFWSGDAAIVHDDGYMQIKDRLKDVIISGGENISSVEIEAVLFRHPSIQAAAVVAKADPKWGEVPCAFVELREGQDVTSDEIIAFCREHLAGFKSPKYVMFQDLPKTSTGKIQKFELRKLANQQEE